MKLAPSPVRGLTAWLILVLSLGLSLGAYFALRRQSAERTQARLDDAMKPTLARIGGRMDAYVALLHGVNGLFRTSTQTSRTDFARYVDALVLRRHYPGVHGVGFASDINDVRTVDALTVRAHQEGAADFAVTPLPVLPPAAIIYFLDPPDELNRRALGYNLAARPELMTALITARDSGQPEIATTISTISGEPWLLLMLPMYQETDQQLAPTATPDERRPRFFGVAYASFVASELFKDIFEGTTDTVAIRVFDGDSHESKSLVYDSGPAHFDWSLAEATSSTPMRYGGHTWTVQLAAQPAFVSLPERTLPPLTGIGGLVFTVVLFILARVDGRARRRAEVQLRRSALIADVGTALTQGGTNLDVILQQCTDALARADDLAAARIFTLDVATQTLVLHASSGLSPKTDAMFRVVKVGETAVGQAASTHRPVVTGTGAAMPRSPGAKPFVEVDGLVVFASLPLMLGGACIGVMTVAARTPLPDDILETLESVADAVALGIQNVLATEALRQSQERYQLATRATQDIIWDQDLLTGQRSWNVGTRAGQTDPSPTDSQEIDPLGAQWTDHIHPEDRARVEATVRQAIEKGEQHWQAEYRFRRHEGAWVEVVDRGFISRRNGEAVRMVGAMQDVSERKVAEAERERLIRSLERSNRDLDHFAYVTSHDLRAPLRGIASISQWIEDDLGASVPEETKQHLELMRGRVKRLDALISGVLAYSRAGRGEGAIEKVSVKELLDETIELLAPVAPAKVVVEGAMPTLTTQKVQLQQVLMNLISNALKYADRPDALASVSAQVEGSGYRFAVKDNGPGIAPQHHERIWGMFQTLQPRDRVEANGIGLAVVKKIVEAHGGKAWVESALGEGATFFFTWFDDQPL